MNEQVAEIIFLKQKEALVEAIVETEEGTKNEQEVEILIFKQKVALAEAIVDSEHGHDVDTLALAGDIQQSLINEGHVLILHYFEFPSNPRPDYYFKKEERPWKAMTIGELSEMNEQELEKKLQETKIDIVVAEIIFFKQKVALAEAIVDSENGHDVDALALAGDILMSLSKEGHALILHSFEHPCNLRPDYYYKSRADYNYKRVTVNANKLPNRKLFEK